MVERITVITAIAQSELDGQMATMIKALGWNQVFRTFFLHAALDAIADLQPDLVLVDHAYSLSKKEIRINPRTRFITVSAETTLEYLTQLERNEDHADTAVVNRFVSDIPVIAFASHERMQGASTLALEYAAALQGSGSTTLLIDAHLDHPFLAPYFDRHRVNREIHITSEGVRLFEFSTDTSLSYLQENVRDVEQIVLDLGVLPRTDLLTRGIRAQERVVRTFAAAISVIHLVTQPHELSRCDGMRVALMNNGFSDNVDIFLNRIQSRKDIAPVSQVRAHFMNDKRAVELARNRRNSVSRVAPRSSIAREMERLIHEPTITRFS